MSSALRLVSLAALLGAAFCTAAAADRLVPALDYETGANLICDTQGQAERFVTLFAGDAQAAIVAVNTEEHNPTACALMDLAYLRGNRVAMTRHGDQAFEVVRILVVGVKTPAGVQPVRPSVYFALFAVKEYAV